eukprot:1099271-Alexandrium_andersonii.AAC.1
MSPRYVVFRPLISARASPRSWTVASRLAANCAIWPTSARGPGRRYAARKLHELGAKRADFAPEG